jgi:SAM-dependent methyltransferase
MSEDSIPEIAVRYYEKQEYVQDAELFARSHRTERLPKLSKCVNLDAFETCLEIGCGAGVHSQDFRGWIGVDLSARALRAAAQHPPRIRALAECLPIKDNCFDLVIAFNVIEHLYHPEHFLNEILRVLRDQGYIVIDSPNIVKKNDVSWFASETIWLLLSRLGFRRGLRARFRPADYSKIGGDSDAVYLVNLIDVMQFLAYRGCEIVSSRPWRFLWWMRGLKDPLIVARLAKSPRNGS